MFSDAEITHNETNDFLNLTAYFLVWELFIFTYKIFLRCFLRLIHLNF